MDFVVLLERVTKRALAGVGGHGMLRVPALQFDHFIHDVRGVLRDDAECISGPVGHPRVAKFEGDVPCFFA